MHYFRYHAQTGEYWGSTNKLNDDPNCKYVAQAEYPLPHRDIFTQTLIWTGSGWHLQDRGV